MYYELQYVVAANEPPIVIGSNDTQTTNQNVMRPVNEDFGIVIPKIAANAPVIVDVNPYDENDYIPQLRRGVAHAFNTSLPNQTEGNMFLFAHSAGNFYEVNQYNAVFYLLNKLEVGDEIHIFFDEEQYVYTVTGADIVAENQVEYLDQQSRGKKTLTLMTCWPAGTTFQRLLVFAEEGKAEDNLALQ